MSFIVFFFFSILKMLQIFIPTFIFRHYLLRKVRTFWNVSLQLQVTQGSVKFSVCSTLHCVLLLETQFEFTITALHALMNVSHSESCCHVQYITISKPSVDHIVKLHFVTKWPNCYKYQLCIYNVNMNKKVPLV